MKRILFAGVCVALCSFAFVQWFLQKPEIETSIIVTQEQQKWLEERFALEDAVNEAQKKVTVLQEKYDLILNEPKHDPILHPSIARRHIAIIEKQKEYAQSKKCTEPKDDQKEICQAYIEAQIDQEWWVRLSMAAVELNAAQHDLLEAKIKAGEFGDKVPEIQNQMMKYVGKA